MKKYISLLLICFMLSGLCVPANASSKSSDDNEKPVLIYTALDFETQSDGENANGFLFYGPDQQGRKVSVAEAVTGNGNDSSRCLMFCESSVNTYGWLHHSLAWAGINKINNDGKFVLSFKLKSSDKNSNRIISLLYNANVKHATHYVERITTGYDIVSVSDSIKAFGNTLVSSPDPQQWYDIAFSFDLQRQMADVYLDGIKKLTANLPVDTQNVAAIKISLPDVLTKTAESAIYIDDFRVYAAPQPMTDEAFVSDWSKYKQSELTLPEKYQAGLLFRYDRFVYHTMYNRFLTAVGGNRFYKDNKFYDLPVTIEDVGDTYIVPLRAFAESFGADVGYNESDNWITITYGNNTMRCISGSDIFYINGKMSKSRYPISEKEGHTCIPMNVLALLFDMTPIRQGNLVILDGKPFSVDYTFDELLPVDWKGKTLDAIITEQIVQSMIYERPTAEDVLNDFNAHNPTKTHPRLIIGTDTFDMLKREMTTDAELKAKIDRVIAGADAYYEQPIVEYTLQDGLRGSFPTKIYDRCLNFSFAYKITGDVKYKDKLWENLEAASKFPDFNPGHYLDVGNAGNGITIAYDWLYYDWEPEQLAAIEKMMYEFVLIPTINSYKTQYVRDGGAAEITGGSNQNIIINNAAVGCAINLIEKYPEECSEFLSLALRSSELTLDMFGPDGGYDEGISYWKYTMRMLPFMIENYQQGLGSDYGMLKAPGFSNTAYFPIFTAGTEGTFNHGDASVETPYDSSMQWFAKEFNDESLAIIRANNPILQGIIDVLYHIPNVDKTKEITLVKDMYFEKVGTATLRTGWSDSDIVACLHGGAVNASHAHEDNGTFLLDAFGERWACELPQENYNLTSYGSYVYEAGMPYKYEYFGRYYRGKAEGHNTVIADLYNRNSHVNALGDFVNDMEGDAFSEILKFSSEEAGGYVVVDMTPTNKLYECALRGVKLDRVLQEVVLQDNFRASEETEFMWSMHTQADVDISSDGKSAILTMGSKRMWVSIISDGDEKFEKLPATNYYKELAPPLQTENEGYTKLAIIKKNSKTFNVSVAFKQLLQGQTEPSVKPIDSPMETWYFSPEADGLPTLSNISVDGETITGFSKNVSTYSVKLATEQTPIPEITAETETEYDIEIIEAKSVPGVTSIVLKDNEGTQKAVYNVIFAPINDTSKFLNDKQIPIMDYFASSEPEANNGVVNLFDANLLSKYATDERGGYVMLDFGESVDVAEIKMAFTNGADRKEFFTLEYSNDGSNWDMIIENGESSGTTTDYQSFTFAPVNARYLRVKFYGNENTSWVSVSELCAFRK